MTTIDQIHDAIIDPDNDVLPPTGSRLVGQRRNIVRSIRIAWPPQEEFNAALDEILYSAIAAPAGPQPGIRLLAQSYAGKSTTAREYARQVLERGEHEDGTIPVAYAKLDPDGSIGSIAKDILTGLGARNPGSLPPNKRWDRARTEMRKKQVRLFLFDEIQRAERRPTLATVIGGKLLDIMDDEEGSCACAFIGRRSKSSIFKTAPDLGNRLDAPVEMPSLIWASAPDRKMFKKFVDDFDDHLVARGATVVKSGLVEHAELLMEASNGLIGQFSRIIETAVMNITRGGHDGITREDLATAVDVWSIPNERIEFNPFDREDAKAPQPSSNDVRQSSDEDDDQEDDA